MSQVQAITSRDNPLLLKLRKLEHDPAAYRKLGEVWVEGEHLCDAVLSRGLRPPVAVIADTSWTGEHGLAAPGDGRAARLSAQAVQAERVVVLPERLWREFSTLPAPVCVGFLLSLAALSAPMQQGVNTVVLDRVQDAGNVGTVLRTAAAMGVRQVVAIKGTAALWSPKVLRAAMGAHWGLVLQEGLSHDDLAQLRVPLVGTTGQAQAVLHETRLPNPCAWVMGHEGQGVDNALLVRCDLTVRIAQPGGEESLNVGVAAALCLYESFRQSVG